MANSSNGLLDETEVPMPPPYNSSNSYGWPGEPMNHQSPSVHSSETSYEHGEGNHPTYHQPKDSKIQSFRVDSDYESLHSSHEDGKRPKSMKPVYIFWFLSKSRYYIRAVAIMVMVISVALILTGAVKFSRAMNDPRFDQIPKNAPITVHPCVVFTGVAALNLALSAAVLLMSCVSTKFRKSHNTISAIFTIISAIGFSTSMGACFFLNFKQTKLENNLWYTYPDLKSEAKQL